MTQIGKQTIPQMPNLPKANIFLEVLKVRVLFILQYFTNLSITQLFDIKIFINKLFIKNYHLYHEYSSKNLFNNGSLEQGNEFLCQDCVDQIIHRHDQNNNNHLLNEEQFKTKLQTELDNLQDRHSYNNQQDPLQINIRKLKTDINLIINQLKEIKQQLEIQSYDDYKYELLNRGYKHIQIHHFSFLGNFAKELLTIDQDYTLEFTSAFQRIHNLIEPINQQLNDSNKTIEQILNQKLKFSSKLKQNEIQQDQFYENCVLLKQQMVALLGYDGGLEDIINNQISTDPDTLSSFIAGNILQENIDCLCDGDVESNQMEFENNIILLVATVYVVCKDQNIILKSLDNKKVFEDQKLAIWEYLINIVENKDIITNVFDRISYYHKKKQEDIN
ncbi:hypothetical protein pb186bvf_005856 [Paramecium bursaria]